MIIAIDVDYRERVVVAAGVGFADWRDENVTAENVVESDAAAAEYEPGQFYRRELPHILGVLQLFDDVTAVVVDGFVWLGPDRPGLGAHLHAALGDRAAPVIGVAKNPFAGATAIEVLRGTSTRPLYITAIGIGAEQAAEHVRSMHGEHRIPTLLRRVDQLCRG